MGCLGEKSARRPVEGKGTQWRFEPAWNSTLTSSARRQKTRPVDEDDIRWRVRSVQVALFESSFTPKCKSHPSHL